MAREHVPAWRPTGKVQQGMWDILEPKLAVQSPFYTSSLQLSLSWEHSLGSKASGTYTRLHSVPQAAGP